MASIHQEIVIEARPEQVWDAVRDVGAIHRRLAPGFVVDTQLEPGARVVTFGNGMVARELIVDLDDAARRLAWSVVGTQLVHHNASLQVFGDGDGKSRAVWIADLLPNEAAGRIGAMIGQGLAAMKRTLERGAGPEQFAAKRKSVDTPSGRISYVEQGTGPVALFVHGVLLNGYLWRHQLEDLSDLRRCIAADLLAHGHTEAAPGQDVSSVANATMLLQFLDALGIDRVDLVGNDSGGGIALIFAARHPDRVRTLALTDCDAHDNWPPEAFRPFLAMVAAGGLRDALGGMLSDKAAFRAPDALGAAYEHPEQVTDETIETYLRPFVASTKRLQELERFLAAFDCAQTVAVEDRLRKLEAPTLVVWATDDVFFDVKWSHWLASTIPGTRRRVELEGARLFFPEERWRELDAELRAHWRLLSAG